MKKIRILSFIILFCLLFSAAAPPAHALEAPDMTARAWIVLDLNTGEVIAEYNADEVRSPASLTKIMTGLLAVEAAERGEIGMDDTVTAGLDCQTGLDSSSSNASIVAGEQMSFRDFFYCAMIVAANEACNVLGSRISGSIGGFVELMNRRAAELGLEHTHFADPNGLSSENHTTARELSVLLCEALQHEEFLTAFTTSTYTVPKTNYSNQRELKSSNALTTPDSYYSQYGDYSYPYAVGAKTGFTRAAGYCLAAMAEKDDLKLLTVVMGCPGPLSQDSAEPENFRDTIRLCNWVFDHFSYEEILSGTEILGKVPVEEAEGEGFVNLRSTEGLTLLLPDDISPEDRQLDVTLLKDSFIAPIPAGTILGHMTLTLAGETYGPYDLVTVSEVKIAKKEYIRKQVDSFFAARGVRIAIVVLALILILYFALVLRYRALRRRHLREMRRAEKRRKAAREHRQQLEDAAKEPTLRFNLSADGDQDADTIDLAHFFEEPAPAAQPEPQPAAGDEAAPEEAGAPAPEADDAEPLPADDKTEPIPADGQETE